LTGGVIAVTPLYHQIAENEVLCRAPEWIRFCPNNTDANQIYIRNIKTKGQFENIWTTI
jgi:hypothetical protein